MEKIKKLVALLLLCTFFAFSSMPLTPFDRGDHQAARAVMSSETNKQVRKPNTVILDFGSAKSDDIKDLRRGEGKVFNKISEKIEELKSSGEVSDNIQPIIVIFKKKTIDRGSLGW